ncbi:hypothetical protein L6452_04394 [Arctium lappa]|uniref:Uncharacterized protein n=1 Tax=Arctium lappa TaxID=4217 RepID=A0ACB9FPZ8_ARCLA|nr:hypothetical protein L6452_04394 [Arctium lappa]
MYWYYYYYYYYYYYFAECIGIIILHLFGRLLLVKKWGWFCLYGSGIMTCGVLKSNIWLRRCNQESELRLALQRGQNRGHGPDPC